MTDLYDEYYYANYDYRPYNRDDFWLNLFDGIASRIIAEFDPKTVLDAGCAWGFLVESLRKRNVEAYGVDISEYAIANVIAEIRPYCWQGSISEPFPQKYNLITCIEVLEHMPPRKAELAIENFCKHANEVVISSTPFGYKELTHINVHDPEYWAEKFAHHGFYRDLEADMSYISPWATRFVKTKKTNISLVREYEHRFWQLSKENYDLRQLSLESQEKIKQLDKQVQAIGSQLAENEKATHVLLSQIAEKVQVAQTLKLRLDQIMSSRSWKLLAPFQRIYAWLRTKMTPK
jgi:cyclopropane fatty-acyl-phospholipid synthase-like methyltransferase